MKIRTLAVLLSIAVLASTLPGCGTHDDHQHPVDTDESAGIYTCPMHPQVVRDEPGSCPICGMDLVLRERAAEGPLRLHVSDGIQQAMNLRTTRVERGRLWRRIDTVGRVQWDESSVHHYHPRSGGWIERVGVTTEGAAIQAGDLLYTLYSPELVAAQEELLLALRRGDDAVRRAARERLRSLDVQEEVIAQIERDRSAMRDVPWRARHDGVVTMLGFRHGMFVQPGQLVLEVVDPSRVWVIADVFDQHAEWLRVGQAAEIRLSSAAARGYSGEVEYVYPQLDTATRTVRARVPLDNAHGAFRADQWTSVRIFAGPVDDVLMVPREAVIRTGHSTRVVLREDTTHFVVREVSTGVVSGDWVEIRRGLREGDEVVVSGQFLIDSEASLRAGHVRLEAHDHD